jgi:hypothetical protein
VHQRLRRLRIRHVYDDYGAGQHIWPYWNRGLRQTLPGIMARFGRAPKPPARVTFTAAEPRYSVYGWSVRVSRPAMEFSRLANASRAGFSLSGSGRARVTTAPLFEPRRAYPIVVRGTRRSVRADRRGRLHVDVPLGPGNPRQQYTAGATTRTFTTRVRIAG